MEKINIDKIKDLIKKNKIRWTNHVIIRLFQRHITQADVEKAILNGEIIEVYENDYPYPSCLIYGINLDQEIIHVVCGSNAEEVWIITAYFPDEIECEKDLKTRRRNK